MIPDEHLRTALRHAPDAHLQAPHDLGAQIIAAAHRASAEPAVHQAVGPAPKRSLWATWIGGRPLRLGTSGALASVVLAGVIGLMWQDAPPSAGVDERVSRGISTAPASVPARVPAPAPAPVPVPAPLPLQAERAQPQAPAPARTRPQAVPAYTPAPLPMAAPAPVPTPAPAASPSPLPSPPPSSVVAAESADAAADSPRPAAVRMAGAAMAPATAVAPAPTRASALSLASPPPPWAALLADAARPSWRLDGQALAVDRLWLQALAQQTQGRWAAATGATPADRERHLLWLLGDVPGGRLWLGPAQATWCGAQGLCQTAPLPDGVAARLLAELEKKRPR